MNQHLTLIMIACFGSVCQEVLHWYEIRARLETPTYKKLLTSPAYWVVTTLMIIISGVGTWLLYGQNDLPKNVYFILGAAFPMIFKKTVRASEPKDAKLGNNVLHGYFFI